MLFMEKENILGYFDYTNKNEPKLVIFGDLAKGLEKIANMNAARIIIDGKQRNYRNFKLVYLSIIKELIPIEKIFE